jgi:ABC-type glutathione transport system ATPase component
VNEKGTPFLSVIDLSVTLGHGLRSAHVLRGVDLAVTKGTTVGIVGESGSGKSTVAKTIVGLHRPDAGSIVFDGVDLARTTRRTRRAARRRIQLVPQDPYSSLDPHRTIGQTLAEAIDPVRARLSRHRAEIDAALAAVAIDADAGDRYPFEFSGGQRQRIAIARALAAKPEIIIADEITSALDVSTQAEILALLAQLKESLKLTLVFISHNLAVVNQICDDVVVLLHGKVVESGSVRDVFSRPSSDYTLRLIESVPGGKQFTLD